MILGVVQKPVFWRGGETGFKQREEKVQRLLWKGSMCSENVRSPSGQKLRVNVEGGAERRHRRGWWRHRKTFKTLGDSRGLQAGCFGGHLGALGGSWCSDVENEQKGSVTDRESKAPEVGATIQIRFWSISKAVELGLKRGEISETLWDGIIRIIRNEKKEERLSSWTLRFPAWGTKFRALQEYRIQFCFLRSACCWSY